MTPLAILLTSLGVVLQWCFIMTLERQLQAVVAMVLRMQARPCPHCKAKP